MSGCLLLVKISLCPLPILEPLAMPISTGSTGFLVDSNVMSPVSGGLTTRKELLRPVCEGCLSSAAK